MVFTGLNRFNYYKAQIELTSELGICQHSEFFNIYTRSIATSSLRSLDRRVIVLADIYVEIKAVIQTRGSSAIKLSVDTSPVPAHVVPNLVYSVRITKVFDQT